MIRTVISFVLLHRLIFCKLFSLHYLLVVAFSWRLTLCQISFSDFLNSLFNQISVLDLRELRGCLDALPVTPQIALEVGSSGEAVDTSSLSSISPECHSESRVATVPLYS